MSGVSERRLDFQIVDRLIGTRLRQRNPNPRNFCLRRQPRNSREVRKLETPLRSTRFRKRRKTAPNSCDRRDESKRRKPTLARLHGKAFLQANRLGAKQSSLSQSSIGIFAGGTRGQRAAQ